MGWMEYEATHFYPNGTVNRKAECDALYESSLEHGRFQVVKSTMIGSIYYGVIRILKRVVSEDAFNMVLEDLPEDEQITFPVTVKTCVHDKSFFQYMELDETAGPCFCDMPQSMLKILSPVEKCGYKPEQYQRALAWRQQCYLNANKPKLGQLPIGTKIKYITYDGEEVILRKHCPAYQFKTPFWYDDATGRYVKKKAIPENFEIL